MDGVTEVFTGLAVAELAPACAWYERLLGQAPDFFPNDREAVWRLAAAAWIYVVTDGERAGRALLTVLVDDLDAHVAALAQRGLVTDPIEVIPNGVRRAVITDPDGNRITFGQPPPPGSQD